MAEKPVVRLEPDESVVKFLNRASEFVSQLPAWKRGILEISSQSTNAVSRTNVPSRDSQSTTQANQIESKES